MKVFRLFNKPVNWPAFTALLMAMSCTSTLYIAPRQGDCTGLAEQKCLLIRSDPSGNWILHNDKIASFDYEPGFSYKIKVKKEHVKNPPMDGSAVRYSLVEILDQKDVASDMDADDLLDKEWKLEYMIQNGTIVGMEDQVPSLRFSRDGKISGNGGCNNYFGSYSLVDRTIRFGQIGATKMMCVESADLEQDYFEVLSGEMRGLFSEGKLILSSDGGNRLVFGY